MTIRGYKKHIELCHTTKELEALKIRALHDSDIVRKRYAVVYDWCEEKLMKLRQESN